MNASNPDKINNDITHKVNENTLAELTDVLHLLLERATHKLSTLGSRTTNQV